MNTNRRLSEDVSDDLVDFLVEDIVSTPDETLLSEVSEDFGEPLALASEFDRLFEHTLWNSNVARTALRKTSISSTLAAWLRGRRAGWAVASALSVALLSQNIFYLLRSPVPVAPAIRVATQSVTSSPPSSPQVGRPLEVGRPVQLGTPVAISKPSAEPKSVEAMTPNGSAQSIATPASANLGLFQQPQPGGLTRGRVIIVQQLLTQKGYDVGQPDGVVGPKLMAVVAQLQRKAGVSVTGYPDQRLFDALVDGQ
jgi:putative peptidoglycan binding protein